mgnify:FL=1
MKILINLVKKDFKYLLNLKYTIINFIIFNSISIFTVLNLKNDNYNPNLKEFILLNMAGIGINSFNFFDFLKWFLPINLFIYYIVLFMYNEWNGRYLYTLLRIKSKKIWIFSKLISISIFSIIYVSLYFFVLLLTYIFSFQYIKSNDFNMTIIMCFIFMVLILIVLSLIIINLSLKFKDYMYIYLVICIILIEPLFGDLLPKNILYILISENAMMARSSLVLDYAGFINPIWSIFFFIILILILNIILIKIIQKKDFN